MNKSSPALSLPGVAQIVATSLCLMGLLGFAPAVVAVNAEASALMEKGVYSEETKGDLDAAMQFYRQVIAAADGGVALAAQAQFRLATCYEKKMDHVAATAAFAKLVHDYPNQKELIALANEHLGDSPDLLPVPWVDGEEMRFNVNLPSGFKAGVARFAAATGEVNGRKIWQFSSHLFAVGVQQWSRSEVDALSFKPIHCRWKHTLFGDADTTYTGGGADVRSKASSAVKHVDLNDSVYDNEQAIPLMRRLPLASGFASSLKVFSGQGATAAPLQLTVETRESVVVPAGTFDCQKVVLNIGQTFWYSTDAHHYLVKAEFGGVVAELASVNRRSATEYERYEDPARSFSVAVPAGWMIDRKEGREDGKRTEIVLLDSDAIGLTVVKVEAMDNFPESARASARAIADRQIGEGKKHYKEFAVRADSWTETTIAGQPAVSVVVDFVAQGKIRQTVCGVYAFVDGNAVDISTSSAPEDFEAFRPQFNAVVASYKGKTTK